MLGYKSNFLSLLGMVYFSGTFNVPGLLNLAGSWACEIFPKVF